MQARRQREWDTETDCFCLPSPCLPISPSPSLSSNRLHRANMNRCLVRHTEPDRFPYLVLPASILPEQVFPFVTPRQIDFLFDCLPQPFAIADEFLNVNVFARKHGEVPFDGRTNFSPRIPIPAEGESESLGNIFDPIVNSSHTTRNLLQAPLLVTAPGQREA